MSIDLEEVNQLAKQKYTLKQKPELRLDKMEQKQLDSIIMQALHSALFASGKLTLSQAKQLENMNNNYWI